MLRQLVPTSRSCLRQLVKPIAVVLEQPVLSRSFSAVVERQTVLPGNLTIDPRSSFAPKSTPSRVDPTPVVEEERRENGENEVGDVDEEDQVFAADDLDDDEDLFLPEPTLLCANPLPDRLHMDIQTLYAPVHDSNVGTIWLDQNVFGRDPIRVDLMKRAVLYYRNKLRGRRKAHSKTISEVSGSRRKIRPQKGQGMARVGHSRPAHHRGGAKAHGPTNLTNYGNTKLNKKVRKQALCHALSQRLLEGNLILLDQLQGLSSYKTRELSRIMEEWGLGGKGDGSSALILDCYYPENETKTAVASHQGVPVPFYLAASNIPRIMVGNDHAASVYQILRHDKLVLTLAALEKLEARLKNA